MPPLWSRWWWTRIFFIQWFLTASQAENKRYETAWIVLRNRRSDKRDLFWVPVTEAEERRLRVEHELEKLPLEEWCERYGVPLSFVDPPPAGVV
jgi:hypothetical protein